MLRSTMELQTVCTQAHCLIIYKAKTILRYMSALGRLIIWNSSNQCSLNDCSAFI